MNCKICKNEMNAYFEGRLTKSMKMQMEEHFSNCMDCNHLCAVENVSNRIVSIEKQEVSNPFLSTRIMASIENLEQSEIQYNPVFQRILKPALISFSIAAAIAIGVFTGTLNQSAQNINEIPTEMAYMNDAALESVHLLSNE